MVNISYRDSVDGIAPADLGGFFVGWPKAPTADTLLRLLAGSTLRVIATDGTKVVGFVTAVTDGVLAAYIPFLEVLPAYQKNGIGSELISRMLRKLQCFYMVDLLCDPELQPFYEKFGMKKSAGMMIRQYENQAGE